MYVSMYNSYNNSMNELLAELLLMEAVLLMVLTLGNNLRTPAEKAVDCVKLGRGPVLMFIIGLIFLAVLMSNLYHILQIHLRAIHADSVNLADQAMLAHKLLQASLVGFLLFLSMVIDKFHNLVRELGSLEKIIKAEEKQVEDKKCSIAVQEHSLKSEVDRLRAMVKNLESQCERKTNEASSKQAIVLALKKQSEGFNLEYDRLLEYNQTLQNQLQSIDQILLKDKQETGWTGLKSRILHDELNLFPQEPNKSGAEVSLDSEVVLTDRCHQLLLPGGHAPSSPRHRRPIYQH